MFVGFFFRPNIVGYLLEPQIPKEPLQLEDVPWMMDEDEQAAPAVERWESGSISGRAGCLSAGGLVKE